LCIFCERVHILYTFAVIFTTKKEYAGAERSGILSKMYSYPVKIVSKGIDKRAKLKKEQEDEFLHSLILILFLSNFI